MLVTYHLQLAWLPPSLAGLAIGALFILPFVLFSATAGQLADKYDKARVMQLVKSLEVGIMALAAWGFMQSHVPALLACVFLMGLHSTLFGPVKYAYLPQHLGEHELTGGNGMVEMGTFVAILLGNLAGGLLIALPQVGPQAVAMSAFGLAVLGRLTAQAIPASPSTDPALRINWNPVTETWANLKLAHRQIAVFRSLLGISWMWFFGAVFLANFPAFAKEVLHGDEHVASVLLMTFSIGIGIGSLLCEKLSRRHVDIGLVPLGAIGMSVFAIDLYFASRSLPPAESLSVSAFLAEGAALARAGRPGPARALRRHLQRAHVRAHPAARQTQPPRPHHCRQQHPQRAVHDRQLAAGRRPALGGLQHPRALPRARHRQRRGGGLHLLHRPRVPAAFLRLRAHALGLPIQGAWRRTHPHARRGPAGLQPRQLCGRRAADGRQPRPIRFIMDHRIFATPVLGWFFRLVKAIPVAPRSEDPAAYAAAFAAARQVLMDGELLLIFPRAASPVTARSSPSSPAS